MTINAGDLLVNIKGDISDLTAKLKVVSKQLKTFSSGTVKDTENSFKKTGAMAVLFGNMASRAVMMVTNSMKMLVKDIVKTGMEFEQVMANVKAVTMATDIEFRQLNDTARELGRTTVFTATQVGTTMEVLAKAGFKTNEIMGAMKGTLNLASAGSLELASAADIAATAIRSFGLEAKDMEDVADTLAYAANHANTSVGLLGEGLRVAGPMATQYGFSLEETVTVLAKLSDVGLKGAFGATTLRQALQSLLNPTEDATAIMDKYNIVLQNTDGTFKSMTEIMGMLKTAGLSAQEALQLLGVRGLGLTKILGLSNDELKNFITSENKLGYAAEVTRIKLATLTGSVTLLKSEFSDLKLDLYELASPVLTGLVKAMSKWIAVMKDGLSDVKQFASNLKGMGDSMIRIIGLDPDKYWSNFNKTLKVAAKTYGTIWLGIREMIIPLKSTNAIQKESEKLWSKLWTTTKGLFGSKPDSLPSGLEKSKEAVTDLKTKVLSLGDKGKEAFKLLGEVIKNEYGKEVIKVAKETEELRKKTKTFWQEVAEYAEFSTKKMTEVVGDFIVSAKDGYTKLFEDVLVEGDSFSDAMDNYWKDMKKSFFKLLADMLAKWIATVIAMKLAEDGVSWGDAISKGWDAVFGEMAGDGGVVGAVKSGWDKLFGGGTTAAGTTAAESAGTTAATDIGTTAATTAAGTTAAEGAGAGTTTAGAESAGMSKGAMAGWAALAYGIVQAVENVSMKSKGGTLDDSLKDVAGKQFTDGSATARDYIMIGDPNWQLIGGDKLERGFDKLFGAEHVSTQEKAEPIANKLMDIRAAANEQGIAMPYENAEVQSLLKQQGNLQEVQGTALMEEGVFTALGEKLNMFGQSLQLFSEGIGTESENIALAKDALIQHLADTGGSFDELDQNLVNTISALGGTVTSADYMKAAIMSMGGSIDAMGNVLDSEGKVVDGFKYKIDAMGNVVDTATGQVVEFTGAEEAFKSVTGSASGELRGLTGAAAGAAAGASGLGGQLRGLNASEQAAANAARNADGSLTALSGSMGRLQSAGLGAAGGIGSAISALNRPINVSVNVKTKQTPGYADGAMVMKPTFAAFAEKGPEAALPLSRVPDIFAKTLNKAGMGMGLDIDEKRSGMTVNNNFTGTNLFTGDENEMDRFWKVGLKKAAENDPVT